MEERAESGGEMTYTAGSLPQERSGETAMHRHGLRL